MRAVSWNWELQVNDAVVHPLEIGEFGEGEEGRIEVADGDRKYKIRDQIFNVDEIPVTILIKKDRYYYEVMQDWCLSGETRTAFLVARDSAHEIQMTFRLANCDCAMGKHNAFDRANKEPDKKTYYLIPDDVEEIQ